MPLQLHETHPSLVHYPLAFFPLSVGADALAALLDRDDLRIVGRLTMPLAAGSVAAAGVSGLIAQEEVEASEHGFDMITTHRNLNLLAGTVAAGMALWRWSRDEVGPGYLAVGAAAFALMGYSAWLGGQMVYDHGIGVKAAGGVRDDVPELPGNGAGRVAARAGRDVVEGAGTAAQETAEGEIAPSLDGDH